MCGCAGDEALCDNIYASEDDGDEVSDAEDDIHSQKRIAKCEVTLQVTTTIYVFDGFPFDRLVGIIQPDAVTAIL